MARSSRWWCGSVALVALACGASHTPVTRAGEGVAGLARCDGPVTVEAVLETSRWAVGEHAEMRLTLTNVSDRAMEIEDPDDNRNRMLRYVVTGAELAEPRDVDAETYSNPTRAPTDPAPLRRLEPGEAIEVDLPIASWIRHLGPGNFELVVELRDKLWCSQTAPMSITIGPPETERQESEYESIVG